MEIKLDQLAMLWYEDEDGNKFFPTQDDNPSTIPKQYNFQISRFPHILRTNCLRIIREEDVEACEHDPKFIMPTGGWINGVEGRKCSKCHGVQVKKINENWPTKWNSGHSTPSFEGNSSWNEELVLAITNSGEYTLSQAIIISSEACERCMNALAERFGLQWGYKLHSPQWFDSNTTCDFCKDEPLPVRKSMSEVTLDEGNQKS